MTNIVCLPNNRVDSKKAHSSDCDLVREVLDGDPNAFANLFHRHKGKVHSVCLRMTKNPALAEDLTQNTFFYVFRKLPQFRGQAAFSTWLYRITVNVVLMQFRRRGTRNVAVGAHERERGNEIRPDFPTTDERLAGCLDRMDLARAIRDLPDGYRTIYLLHDVVGYQHREISKLLACSLGNSKSQLHKARARIRETLKPDGSQRSNVNKKGIPMLKHIACLKEKRSASCLLVEAADGYRVVLALPETDPAFTDKRIVLPF